MTVEEILTTSLNENKALLAEARQTTLQLAELNSLTIQAAGMAVADRTRKAADALAKTILEKASGKRDSETTV